jgi:methylase of polypeptide subunit release factors
MGHDGARQALIVTRPAHSTPEIRDATVDLVVTSPPFLTVVDYKLDNWLRCWFCGIDPGAVHITHTGNLETWQSAMTLVFHELGRVLKPGGFVAFEVGEVRKGSVRLEDVVLVCAAAAGLLPILVLINSQRFTKTANVWGVSNNRIGTNTNRVVVLQKN